MAFRIFSGAQLARPRSFSRRCLERPLSICSLPVDKQDTYTALWEDIEDELGRERNAELYGHITNDLPQAEQAVNIAEFREFVPTRKDLGRFIERRISPYSDAYEAMADLDVRDLQACGRHQSAPGRSCRLDNFNWQPPAI